MSHRCGRICRDHGACVLPRCLAVLAYRDMSDIGTSRPCGAPAIGPSGLYCRRHDPATEPKRDRRGRIVKSAAVQIRAALAEPEGPACALCDCADPTATPGLAAECDCRCHRPGRPCCPYHGAGGKDEGCSTVPPDRLRDI